MDLRTHAERCMTDTENILGEAREWMGGFIHADAQKNEVITVSLPMFARFGQVPPAEGPKPPVDCKSLEAGHSHH